MSSQVLQGLSTLFSPTRKIPSRDYVPLAQRDYGFTERFVTIRGRRICYVDEGTGPTILFLHGLGANIRRWQATLQEFAKFFRVIAYDHPGFGKSEKPNCAYNMAFFAETLRDFVRQLGLNNFHLIGHSLGGAVALDYLLKTSHAPVRSVILVAPAGIRPRHPIWQRGLAALLLRNCWGARLMPRLVGASVYSPNELTDEMVSLAASVTADPEWPKLRRATVRTALAILGYCVREELRNVQVPLGIIWGEQDSLQPVQLALEMHQKVPRARLSVIPDCGHFPMLERPDEFHKVLRSFLTGQGIPYEGCEGHWH